MDESSTAAIQEAPDSRREHENTHYYGRQPHADQKSASVRHGHHWLAALAVCTGKLYNTSAHCYISKSAMQTIT